MGSRRDRPTHVPEGSPVQWKDMGTKAQKVVSDNIREQGNAASNHAALQATADAKVARGGGTNLTKDIREANSLREVGPVLRDRPITMQGATSRRVAMVRSGIARSAAAGMTGVQGEGWYFGHHADIAAMASEHGVPTSTAITASAVMSPQNSPDNEKAAVNELMKIKPDTKITLGPSARTHVGVKKATVNAADLSSDQIGKLSNAGTRSQVDVPGVDLKQMGRSGTATNAAKGMSVLRGETDRSDINPRGGAKVWSYENAIQNAHPNTPEHDEYIGRIRDVQHPGSMRLDLYGLKNSTKGILDPEGHTAEDTWMNTITHGQQLQPQPGSRTSPGKTIASTTGGYAANKGPRGGHDLPTDFTPGAVKHAFNNHATIQAAAELSKGSDTRLPAVAAQELAWSEVRIQAGKDPAFNQAQTAARPKAVRPQPGMFNPDNSVRSAAMPPKSRRAHFDGA